MSTIKSLRALPNPFVVLLLVLVALAAGCKRRTAADFTAMAAELDKDPNAPMSVTRADSLITIYRFAVEADPADHATNLRYLTRAAELHHAYNHDVVKAVDWLLTALNEYGAGQDVANTVILLTRLRAYAHLNKGQTGQLDSTQLTAVDQQIAGHAGLVEARLTEINRTMGGEMVRDTAAGRAFLETAGGYGLAILPRDSAKAADLLEKAAGVAKMINAPQIALDFYQLIADRLPTQKKAATSLFMIGFTYETDLNDTANARKTYEQFLARYPNDELTDDVQSLLRNLGRTPEELLAEFEKMNKKAGARKKRR